MRVRVPPSVLRKPDAEVSGFSFDVVLHFMSYRDLIEQLDNKSNSERRAIIVKHLDKLNVAYHRHKYVSGTNLFVDLGDGSKRIGISSHFDKVASSAGANANGSAIAVCLDLIRRFTEQSNDKLSLRIFFFDEEETGLNGSTAYVAEYGVHDLSSLMNMEMVGMGDKFALWPSNEKSKGRALNAFETVSQELGIVSRRFDQIVTNTADHVPFQIAGLEDAFTITCISEKDLEVAQHYYRALEFDVDRETLMEILSGAPIFEHYHSATDTFNRLSEDSIRMTSDAVWNTIIALQKQIVTSDRTI